MSTDVRKMAESLRNDLGGTIFSFPIDANNPYSKYAIVVYAGGMYHVYPECDDISFAALGVKVILEQMEKSGQAVDFEKDVRLVSFEAQFKGPNVIMRRMIKEDENRKEILNSFNEDFIPNGEEYNITARGLIKLNYFMIERDKNPKALAFMDAYLSMLSSRKYGKTPAAIKQELRKKSKDEIMMWIDRTYKRYIRDDQEIFNLLNVIKENPTSP